MKLSELTPEQKTRLLAELDGWQVHPSKINSRWDKFEKFICGVEETRNFETLPPYLTSYDAIIPLAQKLLQINILIRCPIVGSDEAWFMTSELDCWHQLKATSSQLSDAVLIATGKAEI